MNLESEVAQIQIIALEGLITFLRTTLAAAIEKLLNTTQYVYYYYLNGIRRNLLLVINYH